ncbi:hypothetical protein F4814DRAFT_21718 [Daldinia grandis]|nr:hypothetical protein F4814DRAFT_21718 [Daldinia grandis]
MSGSYKKLPKRKVQMIEAWRAEVESDQNYCACSRLSLGSSQATNEASGSTSTTAVGIDSRPQSPHQSTSTWSKPPVTCPPVDIIEPELLGKATCPTCQSLIDQDISLRELREHEETGLVRKGSPRSSASLLKLDQVILTHEHKTTNIPKKTDIKEQSLNPMTKLKYLGLKTIASSRTLKVKGMDSLRSLKTEKSKKSSPSSDNVGVRDSRPRATETYAQYRLDASSAGSVETLPELCDDERRRPELAIDESAARLRRAARLLDRTCAHIAIEKNNLPKI